MIDESFEEPYELGRCAECGDINIDYGVLDVAGEMAYYPYTCTKCGHEGKEYYALTYQGTE